MNSPGRDEKLDAGCLRCGSGSERRKRELMTKFQIEVDEEVYKELKAIADRWFNGSLNASVKLVLNI